MADAGVSRPDSEQGFEMKDSNDDTGRQDLRRTKAELFNKLIGNQPQQMIVTQNLDKTTKETQLNNSDNNNDRRLSNEDQSNANSQGQSDEQVIFTRMRLRWYTNEEVASILTNFNSHPEWQTNELQLRPKSGAVLLYSREKVRYRQDGYCWKKRKNGRTTREDHMKLKVQGIECIYGCYVHSAILPTFHRRCYWLLQNPDTVLVHYLNQPPDDQNKMILTFNCSLLEMDTRRSWTNEEIIEEIGSVFGGISEIHHTLSINFPSACEASQQNGSNVCQSNDDRMSDTSPHSQNQLNSTDRTDGGHSDILTSANVDEDEIMATGQESNSSLNGMVETVEDGAEDNIQEDSHASVTVGHGLTQQQQDIDSSDRMNFDVDNQNSSVDVNRETCDDNGGQQAVASICYDFDASPNNPTMNLDEGCDILSNPTASDIHQIDAGNTRHNIPRNGGGGGGGGGASSTTSGEEGAQVVDQIACSPVTQIYNKIVDDIETYALPLEPSPFESSHHHLHHHHHIHPISSSMPDQSMDIGGAGDTLHCVNPMINQQQQQHMNQMNSLGHHHHIHQDQQQTHQRLQKRHSTASQHYSDSNQTTNNSIGNNTQSGCAVDFSSCDLFATCGLSDVSNNAADDLLINGFNLTGAPGNLANQTTDDMLIGNSFDPFNFKSSNCFEQKQQLDVKSTTSDTDTLNRLSPMASLVPRCNSTDNAMQPSGQRLDQYQHHLSSHYLATISQQQQQQQQQHHDSMLNSNNKSIFSEFNHQQQHQQPQQPQNHHHHNHQQHQHLHNLHRSVTNSTNPSNSTSCSPSPSSSSLLTTEYPSSAGRSAYLEGSSHCLTGSSSHSFIKLPLQQRQKSEQREPSNTVLNSLLPKALSLDGSDLSATSHPSHQHSHHNQHHVSDQRHSMNQSPMIGGHGTVRQHQMLMPPSTVGVISCTSQQQQQQQQSAGLVSKSAASTNTTTTSARHHGLYQRPTLASISPSSAFTTALIQPSAHSVQYHANSALGQQHQQTLVQPSDARLLPIIDFVPSWAPTSGGTKVVVIGDWTSLLNTKNQANSSAAAADPTSSSISPSTTSSSSPGAVSNGFYVMFDELLAPAILIQDNVLRCYAPAYEPGLLSMKVVYMNHIVSEQVLFEMRSICCVNTSNNTTGQDDLVGNVGHQSNAFNGASCEDSNTNPTNINSNNNSNNCASNCNTLRVSQHHHQQAQGQQQQQQQLMKDENIKNM